MKTNKLIQVLAPYGNWHHFKGNQIVDEQSADHIIKNSKSFFAKNIPIYIGHPDEHGKPPKNKQVGVVENIFKTRNGIIIVSSYNDEIFCKILSGEIKWLSPRWEMQQINANDYRPVKLISVGLTNNPNITNSGKIIDIYNETESFLSKQNTILNSSINKCATLMNKTKSFLQTATTLTNTIAQKNITKRLNSYKHQQPELTDNTKPFSQLSATANEISKKSGEAYTKVFARLKRKIKQQKQKVNKQ